jgi:hypothetical protein
MARVVRHCDLPLCRPALVGDVMVLKAGQCAKDLRRILRSYGVRRDPATRLALAHRMRPVCDDRTGSCR